MWISNEIFRNTLDEYQDTLDHLKLLNKNLHVQLKQKIDSKQSNVKKDIILNNDLIKSYDWLIKSDHPVNLNQNLKRKASIDARGIE